MATDRSRTPGMDYRKLSRRLLPVLLDDAHFLAAAKPAGLDAGGRRDGRGTGLVELLEQLRGRDEELVPINRLSRYESGILLMGKSATVVERVRADLRMGRVRQEYATVVLGRVSKSQMRLTDKRRPASSVPKKPTSRKRKTDEKPAAAGPRSEPATTTVKLVKPGKSRSFVTCHTNVETTHALRAQLRGAGLRVLGDTLHDKLARASRAEQTCLHLARLVFTDPVRRTQVKLISEPGEAMALAVAGRRDIERPLAAALVRRLPLLADSDTDSLRLLTGDAEGFRGLVAEKYGPVIMLQTRDPGDHVVESLRAIAAWYRTTLAARAVCVQDFSRKKPDFAPSAARRTRPLVGRVLPEEITTGEHGLTFAIRPTEPTSVGLFLDQRDNRVRVREMAEGKTVLNLFAYTCGFSVAAAAGGAASIVSVDIAAKHLDWGRRNFELNSLDTAEHTFIRSDAAEYLKRAKRQGRSFDLIILDAPTFAHGRKRGRTFSFARDIPGLIQAACEIIAAGGHMLVSTNDRRINKARLKELVADGGRERKLRIVSSPRLPLDFAVDPSHSKTVIARVP